MACTDASSLHGWAALRPSAHAPCRSLVRSGDSRGGRGDARWIERALRARANGTGPARIGRDGRSPAAEVVGRGRSLYRADNISVTIIELEGVHIANRDDAFGRIGYLESLNEVGK